MKTLGLSLALIACSSPSKPPPEPPMPAPPSDPKPAPTAEARPASAEDRYLWLEEVTSDKALAWARERNAQAQAELEAVPSFQPTRDRIRGILDSKEKTPYVNKRGTWLYNFWTDDKNPKGLIRRTTFAEYKKPKPSWEIMLDIDALGAKEQVSWVYAGQTCVYPKYERCLISLSKGGGDAHVVREFDPVAKAFVDDGFTLPEAKSDVSWKDRDTIYVATDFGPGTLTASGYPRIVKEWKRGTPLAQAKLVFEGQPSDVAVSTSRIWDHGKAWDVVTRSITFFTNETFVLNDGKPVKVPTPADADVGVWNDQLLITLRSEWTIDDKTWPRGALLATSFTKLMAGEHAFTMLFEPAKNKSLAATAPLKSGLIVNELEDIKNRLYVWKLDKAGKWTRSPFEKGDVGSTSVWPVDPASESDDVWHSHTDYLTPSTLSLGALGKAVQPLKRSPAFFDAKGLVVEQHFATSKDGTRIPYFQVSRKTLALDGSNPTLLYGYGGFEVSLTPGYDPVSGAAWDERGGVYAVANIRGGGEYGPAWHQAALRHDRQRAYDDFIAVAEDLIARKVTSTPHLGIMGGSNGGLLMGVMLTQRPDLFGAVVCSVPLLDMKRYHKLLAGASWMEEYGNPEKPEDWAALAKFSPYQNVKAGVKYPRTLFTSSTRDDRVHPGHARKMVGRMLEQGHDVLYYENIEGGHGGAADNEQIAFMQALEFAFLSKQLGLP